MDLKQIPTCELFEELRNREGVTEVQVCPYVGYSIHVNADGDDSEVNVEDSGPASILIVID